MTLTGPSGLLTVALILSISGAYSSPLSSRVPVTPEMSFAAAQSTHPEDVEWRHLRLIRSQPASDTTIAQSPEEIRLFFSEAPQIPGSTVRLTAGSDRLMETTETAADDDSPGQLFIRPTNSLSAGLYTVHWRVMAQDGHAQRGSFEFRIAE